VLRGESLCQHRSTDGTTEREWREEAALLLEDVLGSGCIDPCSLTSALVEGLWPPSRPGRFTAEQRVPCTYWIGPRASRGEMK
jgi:hypothetical protein